MSEPMKTVVQAGESGVEYPDVSAGATSWAYSDERPIKGDTVVVTAHGLRRLLRIASRALSVCS